MRIEAALDKCQAYANCVAVAPEVYDLDGSLVKILQPEPSDELKDGARKGARRCPVKALTIWEDDRTSAS
jgi:ferredoxin